MHGYGLVAVPRLFGIFVTLTVLLTIGAWLHWWLILLHLNDDQLRHTTSLALHQSIQTTSQLSAQVAPVSRHLLLFEFTDDDRRPILKTAFNSLRRRRLSSINVSVNERMIIDSAKKERFSVESRVRLILNVGSVWSIEDIYDPTNVEGRSVVDAEANSSDAIEEWCIWRVHILRLKAMRNSIVNRSSRCTVVGNGPSLNSMRWDTDFLHDEVLFVSNKIYLGFERFGIQPNIFVTINSLLLRDDMANILSRTVGILKVFNLKGLRNLPFDEIPADVIFIKLEGGKAQRFYLDPTLIFRASGTVTGIHLVLARYLGCRRTVLIGVDHTFIQPADSKNKEIFQETDDLNHFDPSYFKKGTVWHGADLSSSEFIYKHAASQAFNDGTSIYDATVGGQLAVFPKTNYLSFYLPKKIPGMVLLYRWMKIQKGQMHLDVPGKCTRMLKGSNVCRVHDVPCKDYGYAGKCLVALGDNDDDLATVSDAIVFTLDKTTVSWPSRQPNFYQHWVGVGMEAVQHNAKLMDEQLNSRFSFTAGYSRDLFDLHMTYIDRYDAHPGNLKDFLEPLPVPYVIGASGPVAPIAAFVSNCKSVRRLEILKQLSQFIDIDFYGKCLNNKAMPTDTNAGESLRTNDTVNFGGKWLSLFAQKRQVIKQYSFTIAMENARSPDYVTEKVYHPLLMGSVPIYWGAPNIVEYVPKNSIIDASDFNDVEVLADYIHKLLNNRARYLAYFNWKNDADAVELVLGSLLKKSARAWPCHICKQVDKYKVK